MSTPTKITCPECSHAFHAEDAFKAHLEQELKTRYNEWAKKHKQQYEEKEKALLEQKRTLDERQRQQEALVKQQVEAEKATAKQEIQKQLQAKYELDLRQLREDNEEKTAALRKQRETELELRKRERQLEDRQRDLELEAERKAVQLREELEIKIRQAEGERVDMKLREKDKQLEDLKRMLEEAKRKSEQGSVQLQGEVQELALEEMLRSTFPFDLVEEVGKGVRGADAVQTVRNQLTKPCGRIIYESKRTKMFNREWLEKLKMDARMMNADFMVLVTETMPKEMTRFGQLDGVWICSFAEVQALAFVLRDCLLQIAAANASQENKGTKMHLLYGYLTGPEFRGQIENVVEAFMDLQKGIARERVQMEKGFKEREKQLQKALMGIIGFYGSVRGIAGSAIPGIDLLGDGNDSDLPDAPVPLSA
jgi:hypothetical protein